MNTIYDVDFFIKKFKAIPSKKIIAGYQDDMNGNHCALGWCNPNIASYNGVNAENDAQAQCLHKLFKDNGIGCYQDTIGWNIAEVNNGNHPLYKQKTPKQRILAALYDIKKAHQPKVKEIIRYVAVSEKIRNDVKVLQENNQT